MTPHKKRFLFTYPAIVLFALIWRPTFAQDWPQWRGANRDGAVHGFVAPKAWPEKLKPMWKTPVGTGHSSPLVMAARIYQHARQDDDEVVLCIDLSSGKTLWRQSYPAPYSMNFAAYGHGKGPKSTPAFHEGKLYTLGISSILSCFDAVTGALKWRKEFSKQFNETSPAFGVSMSPVVDNGLCIVHAGGPNQGALLAFEAETGNVKWSWQDDGPGHASPIVVDLAGTRQIITQTKNFVLSVAVATGQLLWKIPFTTDYDQNIVTPIVYQDLIIFSGLEKGTTAIRVAKSGTNWITEQVWHNKNISMYMSSPVLSGTLLFGLSHQRSGQFFCLDAKTGATLWSSEGRQAENAAILIAGEFLFLLNDEANLVVARASAKAYEPLAKYTVADSETWAHPVLIGKQILVKDKSDLALWSIE